MADDLVQLETWAAPLIAKLSAPARQSLAMALGRRLRASQQKRIAAQLNPSGEPFAPRKPQEHLRDKRGAIRRRKAAMFGKLRTARWLKVATSATGVEIGFTGRVARIARVHQEGLTDRANANSREVQYPRRQLLGLTPTDRQMIAIALEDHLRDL